MLDDTEGKLLLMRSNNVFKTFDTRAECTLLYTLYADVSNGPPVQYAITYRKLIKIKRKLLDTNQLTSTYLDNSW